MANDLLSQIADSSRAFTRAERKVADFVLHSPHEVMYMSITDLAQRCEVGDTTVFRFCKTLRLSGYQVFKMMLAQSLSNTEKVVEAAPSVQNGSVIEEVCRKLLNTYFSALTEAQQMINAADISKTVDMMAGAQLIHFYGVGASSVMALEACNKFARVLPNVISIPDVHMQALSSSLLNENDLAFAFSYSGSTKDIVDILKRAKENRARTVCVTRFSESPLTAYADVVLLCGADEGPFQGGALSARATELYLMDILYTEYFKKYYTENDRGRRSMQPAVNRMP